MQTTVKRKYYMEFRDLADYGFPELPLFGAYKFDKAVEALQVHTHRAFEICYLVEGRQNYRAFGRDYLLKGGDLFITKPDEPHSTGKQPQEKGSLFWMHLMPPRKNKPFLGLHPLFGRELYASISRIMEKCYPGSPMIRELFEKIHVQLQMPETPSRKITMSNLLASLILEIVACSEKPLRREGRNLNKIIQYMNEKPEAKISVPEMAEFMGMSVSRFKTRFRHETGMPPAEYFLRLKIAKSRGFMETGKGNVSETAMRFGFSSSQHFATAFKRFTGISPSRINIKP
ncbi:MAG: AraC family transcriptional regulator [Victivallales bacterium]|jgi:AraC-like DNA-binding protein